MHICVVKCVSRVLQCVAVWISALMSSTFDRTSHLHGKKTVYFSVLQFVFVCCSVLQCLIDQHFWQNCPSAWKQPLCCSVLQYVADCCRVLQRISVRHSVLQCVAVCCSVLQCVAVCCSVLQCVAPNEPRLVSRRQVSTISCNACCIEL